jgi:hypothetical protein
MLERVKNDDNDDEDYDAEKPDTQMYHGFNCSTLKKLTKS